MSEKETWYDEEIAPKLAELAKACGDHGCSFLALVETDEVVNETRKLEPGYSWRFATAVAAAQNGGNVDGMILSLLMHAKHYALDWQSSFFLRAADDGMHLVGEENKRLKAKLETARRGMRFAYEHGWTLKNHKEFGEYFAEVMKEDDK